MRFKSLCVIETRSLGAPKRVSQEFVLSVTINPILQHQLRLPNHGISVRDAGDWPFPGNPNLTAHVRPLSKRSVPDALNNG
jgi:hypothetical protein